MPAQGIKNTLQHTNYVWIYSAKVWYDKALLPDILFQLSKANSKAPFCVARWAEYADHRIYSKT